jgi:hypothetical protein
MVILSKPPTAKVKNPTEARPSVHTQSTPGTTPRVVSNHPTPTLIKRIGNNNVFLSGFIKELLLLMTQ